MGDPSPAKLLTYQQFYMVYSRIKEWSQTDEKISASVFMQPQQYALFTLFVILSNVVL